MAISMLVLLLLLAGVHAQSPTSSPELRPSSSLGPVSSPELPSYLGPSSSLGPVSSPELPSSLGPSSFLGPASSPELPSSLGPSSSLGPASSPELPSYQGPSSSLGPASAPTDCATELLGLSDCLSYVSKGSNTTVPDKGCCPGLSGLVDNAPQCLCQLIGQGEVLGLPIDKKKSLELPTVCHVTTPPISLCSLLGVPVSSPTPAPSSGGGPSSGGAPSGGLELPTSSTPALSPSSSRGSRGFRACNVFFFVALFFTGVSLIIF